MKKFSKAAALLLAIVLLFSACGGGGASQSAAPSGSAPASSGGASEPSGDRVLNLSTLAPLTTIDPHDTTNLEDIIFHKQVFEPLVFQNEASGEFEPRIAESYTISDDGLTYTFAIRQGVKFHNGNELKASDVVFSYKRAMESPKVRNYLVTVADVTADGDYTVVIKMKQPNAAFLTNQSMIFIIDQAEVEEQGDEFGTKLTLAGTGPFFITSLQHDVEWTCDAFPEYYRGEAAIKKLHYAPIKEASAGLIAFESGELDWYLAPIANWDALTANANYKTELVPANHISFICLNYLNAPLDDDNLRKAIAYAMDKDAMNMAVFNGYATNADFLVPAQNTGAPTEGITYDYDVEKAKEYLAKSAYPNGTHVGTINCSAGGIFEKIAQVLQDNLAAIGLTCDINRLESATNLELARNQKFEMLGTGSEVVGDYDYWRLYCHTEAVGAYYIKFEGDKFDYRKMDELWDAGIATADVAERQKIYRELNDMIMDTATMLPIFNRAQPYVWTPDLNVPMNYPMFPQVYEWSWN